jgi:2-(1,2-epoxy-1,2-dihydrophenyl)acetyl-CoA isomerase
MSEYAAVPGLLVSHDDQILRLTIDLAPRRNALDDVVLAALIDAVDTAGRDEDVRVIVPGSAASSAGSPPRPTG